MSRPREINVEEALRLRALGIPWKVVSGIITPPGRTPYRVESIFHAILREETKQVNAREARVRSRNA